jgi:hypothetical protein
MLALGPGTPAVLAKAAVVIAIADDCGRRTMVAAEVATAAPAGAREWTLAAAVGRYIPAGALAIVTQLRTIALADLRAGDVLAAPTANTLVFGLAFSGAAPNLTLTRLVRVCRDDPCPRLVL